MDLAELRLRPARRRHRPAAGEPRDAARLLVDAGSPGAAVAHRTVADLPDLRRPRRRAGGEHTRVLPARLRLRKPTGGEVEVLLLERARRRPVGGAGPPQPPGAARHRCCVGRRRPGGRGRRPGPATAPGEVDAAGRRRRRGRAGGPRPPRRRAAAAVHHRAAGRPRALPDRVRRPARLGGRPDRRPPPHRRGARRAAGRPGRPWRPSSWSWAWARSGRSPPTRSRTTTCTPSATRCRRRPWPPASGAGPRGRVVAVGTTTVRALESAAAAGELTGRTELFIHRPWTWRVVDVLLTNFHLPRSSLLVLRRRVRRAPLARPLRRRAGRGLPVPVLRRRHAG